MERYAPSQMSLLRDLQAGTTEPGTPLADLLRKCKVLAKRLHHQPLDDWANNELTGYKSDDTLPDYRKYRAEVTGTFAGPFQKTAKNIPVPSASIKDEHREILYGADRLEGVAHYESLLESDSPTFSIPWPADYIAHYQEQIMEGFNLVEAHRIVPRGAIEGMLDQIRTRILSFALEIEEQNPDAGEAEAEDELPVPSKTVEQIYNTYILGGTNVIASGSNNIIRDFMLLAQDWDSLTQALLEIGLGEEDVEALDQAVKKDGGAADGEAPGEAVRNWLDEISSRMRSGSLKLAAGASGSMVGTLVLEYLKSL